MRGFPSDRSVTPASGGDGRSIEHFHRHRAQIEERLKESKLGQALRHLPSGDQHANRVWLTAALLALNLTAFCCDLCPAARASGKAPADAPPRRAAKTLRNLLFCIPARIVRTGRRLILRPPASATARPSRRRSTPSTRSGPEPSAGRPRDRPSSQRPPSPATQKAARQPAPRQAKPPPAPPAKPATPSVTIRLTVTSPSDGPQRPYNRHRWAPAGWWPVLFRWPPSTARGSGGRDSDIGSPVPRRATRASCLLGWSSGAPSTVA
jgi:DDE family transposase